MDKIEKKIYLEDGHAEPIVGFVGPAWNNPKDLINPIEYIRVDTLREWLEQEETQYQQWFKTYGSIEDNVAVGILRKVISKIDRI